MAVAFKIGDVVNLNRAQIDQVTILDATIGFTYQITIAAPTIPGFPGLVFSYIALVGQQPGDIANALLALLSDPMPAAGFLVSAAGAVISIQGPLGVAFTTTVSAHESVATIQQSAVGQFAENIRVIFAKEFWAKDPATGQPIDRTIVRGHVVGRADVLDFFDSEVLTAVDVA